MYTYICEYHDGRRERIEADGYELEGNEYIFRYADGRKKYEVPLWMVHRIELVAAEKAAEKKEVR